MKLLNSKNDNMKSIGSHITIQDYVRLALYCILEGKSKSKFLKELIQKELNELPDLDKLINFVYKEILQDWNNKKQENQDKNGWKLNTDITKKFLNYKTNLKTKLRNKKIPEQIISKIINKLDS